jgi:predicted RNase H-like nuclease
VISVGADGFAGGWVAVELRDGAFARAWVASTVEVLFAGVPDGAFVGVDMPVGLVDSGWRTADLRARGLVGGRHNSVFRIPPRGVWRADDLAEAQRRCRDLTGAGLSAQTWSLRRKVLEVSTYPGRLFEVHPEVVFATIAGRPLPSGKRTWNGQAARRALLARAGVVLPDDLGPAGSAGNATSAGSAGNATSAGSAGAVPVDDVLDAAVVAWCAYRIGLGEARHVPDPPVEHDRITGRPIVIWYAGLP